MTAVYLCVDGCVYLCEDRQMRTFVWIAVTAVCTCEWIAVTAAYLCVDSCDSYVPVCG